VWFCCYYYYYYYYGVFMEDNQWLPFFLRFEIFLGKVSWLLPPEEIEEGDCWLLICILISF